MSLGITKELISGDVQQAAEKIAEVGDAVQTLKKAGWDPAKLWSNIKGLASDVWADPRARHTLTGAGIGAGAAGAHNLLTGSDKSLLQTMLTGGLAGGGAGLGYNLLTQGNMFKADTAESPEAIQAQKKQLAKEELGELSRFVPSDFTVADAAPLAAAVPAAQTGSWASKHLRQFLKTVNPSTDPKMFANQFAAWARSSPQSTMSATQIDDLKNVFEAVHPSKLQEVLQKVKGGARVPVSVPGARTPFTLDPAKFRQIRGTPLKPIKPPMFTRGKGGLAGTAGAMALPFLAAFLSDRYGTTPAERIQAAQQ